MLLRLEFSNIFRTTTFKIFPGAFFRIKFIAASKKHKPSGHIINELNVLGIAKKSTQVVTGVGQSFQLNPHGIRWSNF